MQIVGSMPPFAPPVLDARSAVAGGDPAELVRLERLLDDIGAHCAIIGRRMRGQRGRPA